MRATYEAMYRLGLTPWDRGTVAAELRAVVEGRPPGRAVDLGCGTGLQARWLAARGWEVTAVDVVRPAVRRARAAGPEGGVTWRVADVARAERVDPDGRLAHTVDLILDDRCLHGLADRDRPGWARTVEHLAAPRAELLVRAGARHGSSRPGPAGLDQEELTSLLGEDWIRRPSPGPSWSHLRRTPSTGAAPLRSVARSAVVEE